jgi:hypothetical protein
MALEVRVWIRSTVRVQGQCDGLQHAIDVTGDVVIPKPQHAIVVIGKALVAYAVALISCVLAAIDLDDETSLAANEIDDVGSNRLLADEFVSSKRAGADAIPQALFRVCR